MMRLVQLRKFSSKAISLPKYIAEVKPTLKPPVSNRMIYNEQLQLMVVGGPNQRKDFHINEGEEIFYQIDGAMNVNVLENGKHKTVHIPQGHIFILPSRIPHSPQRYADTIGIVVERLRKPTEFDGLRYFVPGTTNVLYEEYFNCKDLGSELVPVINRFFSSECSKTNIPAPGMPHPSPPVTIDSSTTISTLPFDWNQFLSNLASKSTISGFLVQGAIQSREYNLNIAFGDYKGIIQGPRQGNSTDTLFWQYQGSSLLKYKGSCGKTFEIPLEPGAVHLAVTTDGAQVEATGDSRLIAITNNAFDHIS